MERRVEEKFESLINPDNNTLMFKIHFIYDDMVADSQFKDIAKHIIEFIGQVRLCANAMFDLLYIRTA